MRLIDADVMDKAKAEHEAIEKIEYILEHKCYPEAHDCNCGECFDCELALEIKDIEQILDQLN